MDGKTIVKEWRIGWGSKPEYYGIDLELADAIDAALAAANRAGQEAMRERAARIAHAGIGPECSCTHYMNAVGRMVETNIRALPVE